MKQQSPNSTSTETAKQEITSKMHQDRHNLADIRKALIKPLAETNKKIQKIYRRELKKIDRLKSDLQD